MDIKFKNTRLEKLCNSGKQAKRQLGAEQAEALRSRLDDLDAAENLSIIAKLSQHDCHELSGDRKGELAIKLKGGLRLIFVAGNDPVPRKPDGGLDWTRTTTILLTEIGDYH